MNSFIEPLSNYLDQLTSYLEADPTSRGLLEQVQQASGNALDNKVLVGSACSIILSLIYLIAGGRAISYVLAFVIPCYHSTKAVLTAQKEDDKFWLTYWIVYSFFITIEGVFDFILSGIPFYELMKCGLFVCLWHPEIKLAETVFQLAAPHLGKLGVEVEKKSD